MTLPCPICGGEMAERGSRKGPFLGCIRYPACRGTAPVPFDPEKSPTGTEPTALCVFDTETTGTGSADEVIEVACAIVDPVTLRPLASHFARLVRPTIPVPAAASAIHGILDEHLMFESPASEVFGELFAYVSAHGGERPAWCAHNASFDIRMVGYSARDLALPGYPVYCSLGLARASFPKMSSHRLEHLAKRLGIQTGTAHRALGDVLTTLGLVTKIRKVWDDFAWGSLQQAGRL